MLGVVEMDKAYWASFYRKKENVELEPSLFAQFIESSLAPSQSIIELGCGDGRDAVFFSERKHYVLAVDQCEDQITSLSSRYVHVKNLHFFCDDFTSLSQTDLFDVVYSRFTLHSITRKEEDAVLKWTYNSLNIGGAFCVEVRGQKNEIYGMGTPVESEPHAFIFENHFRRFVNLDDFCEKLNRIGFEIKYSAEAKGFAPFNGQNETFIRVIANKNNDRGGFFEI